MAVGALGSALRGGVAFLTRLADGAVETDRRQFQSVPAVFPAVGSLVCGFAAVSFVVLGPTLPRCRSSSYWSRSSSA